MNKHVLRFLVGLCVLAGAYFGVRAWLAQGPVDVRVARVERGAVESTLSNSKAGTVKARRRARLAPEVAGLVAELPRRRGDEVRAGDVLVRLADASARAQLVLAERALELALLELDRACIAAERAHRELERNRDLASRSVVSADTLDAFESAYATASATCKSRAAEAEHARAAIAAARAELDKTVLRAPFDGVVAELFTEVGEWITPAPPLVAVPPVIDLIDPSSLYVSAPMDEVDSARFVVGQRAKVTLDPHPGSVFAGRVVRVAPYVLDAEAQNRTVEIEVDLGDRTLAQSLLPGTSADVEVVLMRLDDVVRVPRAALLGGKSVLVLARGRIEERAVEVGVSNWDFVEVRSGLAAGEQVVVSLDRPGIEPGVRARSTVEEGAP